MLCFCVIVVEEAVRFYGGSKFYLLILSCHLVLIAFVGEFRSIVMGGNTQILSRNLFDTSPLGRSQKIYHKN